MSRFSVILVFLIAALSLLAAGCYSHHERERAPARDAGSDAGAADALEAGAADAGVEPAECDLTDVECTALPGCHGASPPETLYCDDVRICILSDPGDTIAMAIAAVAERIRCRRADSCDFLCAVEDGGFDDEVVAELCEIARVAPDAPIECAIHGP